MDGPGHGDRGGRDRRVKRLLKIVLPALSLAWASLAVWHSAKPLPAGTHVASQTSRLPESDVDFWYDYAPRVAAPDTAAIDHAEQLIVLDRSPVTQELAQHLLARRHARPNIKIVLVTDPAHEAFGGTPARLLAGLEESGIIVSRVRLTRLRDSNPLYSGLWRLGLGWWSDPFDEPPGAGHPGGVDARAEFQSRSTPAHRGRRRLRRMDCRARPLRRRSRSHAARSDCPRDHRQ